MFYILASDYNEKLHHHITAKGVQVQYISNLEQLILNHTDTLIVDGLCLEDEHSSFYNDLTSRCICMGDDIQTYENIIYISKYQPIEAICLAIFNRQNLLITIIGDDALFTKIMKEYPNCNFIDFTYNPESDLSLIQILDNCDMDLLKIFGGSNNRILYPITTIMDLLDPPIKFVKPMMDALKKKRDTIVRIDKLKGTLDLMLLNLSDLIIVLHEEIGISNKQFDTSLKKIMDNKKIISLNVSTKTYEKFKLSDHMLHHKEA